MKRTLLLSFLILCIVVPSFAISYKPIYVGRSICNNILIKDQQGNKFVPIVGDVVTLTLWRTSTSTPALLTITGVYVADEDDYNYTFELGYTQTTGLGIGNALWYLENKNVAANVYSIIDISKVVIKK